ncbi:MAG TPA: ABC transporter ATP-binding protein [Clostridiales bacterium]|jgi:branched-chain amino acid transport system ATP-binding protein|nr:ABC transporter ATP-binding protein [Clostridiales bacterium]
MSNILEIKDITVMYGKSVAIHDISLNVPEGKIVTMVGANGAGKSTTLKALAGIVPVTQGSICFRGEELVGQSTQEIVRKGIVLVPEGRHLFPHLSVYKNLQLGATLRTDKIGIQEDLEYIYDLFPKLKERRKQKAGTLSGGEQQMLAIARGIMASPKLLCLDEPSLGLAPVVIEQLGQSINDINKTRGVSILLVEQNVHLAFGVADYCYAMSVGAMVAQGDVDCISSTDAVRKAYFGG